MARIQRRGTFLLDRLPPTFVAEFRMTGIEHVRAFRTLASVAHRDEPRTALRAHAWFAFPIFVCLREGRNLSSGLLVGKSRTLPMAMVPHENRLIDIVVGRNRLAASLAERQIAHLLVYFSSGRHRLTSSPWHPAWSVIQENHSLSFTERRG